MYTCVIKIIFLDHQTQPQKNLFLDQQQQISEVRSTGRSTDVHNVHTGVGGRPASRPLWKSQVTAVCRSTGQSTDMEKPNSRLCVGRPDSRPTWRTQLSACFRSTASRPLVRFWVTVLVYRSTGQSTGSWVLGENLLLLWKNSNSLKPSFSRLLQTDSRLRTPIS